MIDHPKTTTDLLDGLDDATIRLIEREAERQDIPAHQVVKEAVESWCGTLDAMDRDEPPTCPGCGTRFLPCDCQDAFPAAREDPDISYPIEALTDER